MLFYEIDLFVLKIIISHICSSNDSDQRQMSHRMNGGMKQRKWMPEIHRDFFVLEVFVMRSNIFCQWGKINGKCCFPKWPQPLRLCFLFRKHPTTKGTTNHNGIVSSQEECKNPVVLKVLWSFLNISRKITWSKLDD